MRSCLQIQAAAQRRAVSPVPPHRLGLVRRMSTDINTALPPPSPVHPVSEWQLHSMKHTLQRRFHASAHTTDGHAGSLL
jgi:hypothetical protein